MSKVETQHSFLNGLVGSVTLGIYTLMDLTVTCAAAGSASLPPSETGAAANAGVASLP